MEIRHAAPATCPTCSRCSTRRVGLWRKTAPASMGQTLPTKEMLEADISAQRSLHLRGRGAARRRLLPLPRRRSRPIRVIRGGRPGWTTPPTAWYTGLRRRSTGAVRRRSARMVPSARCGNIRIDTHRDNQPMAPAGEAGIHVLRPDRA